ncbi:MAG: hypothetical protein ACPL7A_01730, partial [Anaerolineales bacterium]
MKNQISLPFFFSKNKQWIFVLTLLLIASLSCTLSGNSDTNLIQTQTALGIQMTMMAQQQSSQMQQQTSDANMKTQIA